MDLINIYKIYVLFQQFYYIKNSRIVEKYMCIVENRKKTQETGSDGI